MICFPLWALLIFFFNTVESIIMYFSTLIGYYRRIPQNSGVSCKSSRTASVSAFLSETSQWPMSISVLSSEFLTLASL